MFRCVSLFFFKQKTAYDMRISDWSSDVCSSDLEALDLLVDQVKPGVTTDALDALVFDFAMAHGAIPAPLNYRGFPKSICTSLNHVVRSAERRGGKECVSTSRSRWSSYH